jgi:hypothetical protein
MTASTKTSLAIPTVHLNGTGKDDLLEALEVAYSVLGEAYRALKRTAPNGRDYYVQPAGALEQAVSEHHARLKAVDDVRSQLSDIAEAIQAQGR